MQKVFLFLIIFFLVILQIGLFPRLKILTVSPNILFVFAAVFAVYQEEKTSLFWAALAGLALDVFSRQPFGFYSLSFLIVVWLINSVGKTFFRIADFFGRAFLLTCASVVYAVLNVFLLKIFAWLKMGLVISIGLAIWPTLALELLLNVALIIIIMLVVDKYYGFFNGRQKRI